MSCLTEGYQKLWLTIDLSLMFNENGYINESDNNKYKQNNSVTHIILVQSNDSPIKIGDNFLYGYCNLITIDIQKPVNVIAIGNNFLRDCCNLTIFDATKLTSLIIIGNNFFRNCSNLIIFDATKLIYLTTIGHNFLSDCCKLIDFNTIGLISLKYIDGWFLYDCNNNLTITVKNPPDCLRNKLLKANRKITQLYNRPIIYLVNNCVI